MIAYVFLTIESIEEVFVKKEVEIFPFGNIWRNEFFYMFVFYPIFPHTKLPLQENHEIKTNF